MRLADPMKASVSNYAKITLVRDGTIYPGFFLVQAKGCHLNVDSMNRQYARGRLHHPKGEALEPELGALMSSCRPHEVSLSVGFQCIGLFLLCLPLIGCTDKRRPHFLEAHTPTAGHLKTDEEYLHSLRCQPEGVLVITVNQDNLDVTVTLSSRVSGSIEFDSPSLRFGQETVLVRCTDSEELKIRLKGKESKAPGGRFAMSMTWVMPETPSDILDAYQHLSEAGQIHAAGGTDAWVRSARSLQRTLPVWQRHGMREMQALVEYQLASLAYLKILDWASAVEHARRAHGLYVALHREQDAAASATLLGAALEELAFASSSNPAASTTADLFTEAEQVLVGAREDQIRLKRPFDAAMSLDYLAICHYYRGQYADAIVEFRAAERELATLGERTAQIMALQNLATILSEFGRYREAITEFERLMDLVSTDADSLIQAAVVGNYVNALRGAGELERALDIALQALELNRRRNDVGGEARSLYKIADLYQKLGDSDRALLFYEEALPKAETANQRRFVFRTLTALGDIQRGRGDLAAAQRLHTDALRYSRPGIDQAEMQLAIGLDLSAGGRHTDALARFSNAAQSLPRDQNPYLAPALTASASAYRELGKLTEARALLSEALTLTSPSDRPAERANTLREMALTEFAGGNAESALMRIQQAIDILERIHGYTLSPLLRANFRQSRQAIYATQIQFLMAEAQPCRRSASCLDGRGVLAALETVESSRMRWSQDTRTWAQADPELRSLWDELRDRRTALDDLELGGATKQKTAELRNEVGLLRTRVEMKERSLSSRASPEGARPVVDASRIKVIQQRLPVHGAAVEFLLSSPKSWAWIIEREHVHAVALPSAEDIEKAVERFYSRLQTPDALPEAIRDARALYNILHPVFGELTASDLWVVPDGALHSIPLRTLIRLGAPERPVPSITVVPSLAGNDAHANINRLIDRTARLVFVTGSYARGERLPFAEKEYAQIRPHFAAGRSLLLTGGKQAHAVMSERDTVGTLDMLHIAAHAQSDPTDPVMSRILLNSGKEPLSAISYADILRLHLPARLVVLSGCETAIGRRFSGDGTASLAMAFLDAGAQDVVASHWRISDQATLTWMSTFYAALVEQGQPPGRALMAAESAVQADPRWRHPYYWGAFTLASATGSAL